MWCYRSSLRISKPLYSTQPRELANLILSKLGAILHNDICVETPFRPQFATGLLVGWWSSSNKLYFRPKVSQFAWGLWRCTLLNYRYAKSPLSNLGVLYSSTGEGGLSLSHILSTAYSDPCKELWNPGLPANARSHRPPNHWPLE